MSYYPAEIGDQIVDVLATIGPNSSQDDMEKAERDIKKIRRSYFIANPKPSSYQEMVDAGKALTEAEFNTYYTAAIWPDVLTASGIYQAVHLVDIQNDPSDNRRMFIQKSMDLFFQEKISQQSSQLYKFISAGTATRVFSGPFANGLTYDTNTGHVIDFSNTINSLSATEGRAAVKTIWDAIYVQAPQNTGSDKGKMAAAFGYLGFNEELNKILPTGIQQIAAGGAGGTSYLELLENTQGIDPEKFGEAIAHISGEKSELTPEVERRLRQCALFLYYLRRADNPSQYASTIKTPGKNAYSDRILPIYPGAIDPDLFVNMCTVPDHCQKLFNEVNSKVAQEMELELFWVYSDNNSLREVKINTKQSDLGLDLQKRDKILKKDASADQDKKDFIKKMFELQNDAGSKFQLTETKITMEGQDPATSRTDLKVDLTFEIDHFSGINAVCAIAEMNGDDLVSIKIKDLITLPNVQTVETDQHFQGLANQYHPDYSRVRLKMYPAWERDLDGKNVSHLILDLTTIGHNISRDSQTGQLTLVINYRGYFEQSLNMPANDALASPTLIQQRQDRAKDLYDITKDGKCTTERLRRILAANREVDRLESEEYLRKGKFIERLLSKGILYEYTESPTMPITQGRVAQSLDPRLEYIDTIDLTSTITYAVGPGMGSGRVGTTNLSQEDRQKKMLLRAKKTKQCFFLGDLLELITDCLYEPGTADHRSYVKNLNMKFIVSNIKLPKPDPRNISNVNVNPVSIPIDLGFFLDWFYETFSKKGVSSYPVGPFLRDFLERLINDVLYDTCYTFLLPDERPPELGVSFFVDNSGENKFFELVNYSATGVNSYYMDPLRPYGARGPGMGSLLMPTNQASPAGTSKTYCCIYQKYVGSFRTGRSAGSSDPLRDSEYVPTLYSGKGVSGNYLSNVTFKKTEVPYLRESKYFNNSYGLIGLLANVYDLSFKFEHQHANTYFYPGMIFNFILTDFMNIQRGFVPGDEDATESDPHLDQSIANVMGFGGYYITTKVVYTRGKTNKNWTIEIDSSFFGTDADGTLGRTGANNKPITEDADCIKAYNEAAIRVTQTSITTGQAAQEFGVEIPGRK